LASEPSKLALVGCFALLFVESGFLHSWLQNMFTKDMLLCSTSTQTKKHHSSSAVVLIPCARLSATIAPHEAVNIQSTT